MQVNFDPERVLERDIKDHFKPYGELARVQIKRNYAFVEYKTIADAIDAVKSCDNSRLMGGFSTLYGKVEILAVQTFMQYKTVDERPHGCGHELVR